MKLTLCIWVIYSHVLHANIFFYTTCKAQLTVSTCTCIYNIFHSINNIHDSFLMDFTAWWVPFTHEYQSSTNYETKFFFIIIFHKNVFTHKITCLLICQKNHVIYDNWSKRVTQYVPFWFLIHKHSPCTVIVLKHLTFSSPWWIVIITPYSNHWGVHPNYVTQIQIKIWSTFFYKKFLFFLKLGWMLQKDKVT